MTTTMSRELAALCTQLAQWRKDGGGGRGKRIPEAVWQQAAEVARVDGIHATARATRLNFERLKASVAAAEPARAEAEAVEALDAGPRRPSHRDSAALARGKKRPSVKPQAAQFVSVQMAPVAARRAMTIELTSRSGDCMRIESTEPKFEETAVAMVALCRYGTGLPLHRLERLQRNVQTPLSSSTQWDALDQNASALRPAFEQLERVAAQGAVTHDDDTYVRILAFMGERRAKLLQAGLLPDPDRTGLFTTAIVSNTESGVVALFYSGRKHAGENLNKLLTARDPERAAPILMSDALARNVPRDHAVVEANCTAHARRGIVHQYPNFPVECQTVLLLLREVFAVEARCKERKLSADQRLEEHREHSAPVMNRLHAFMTTELENKRVEPNSGLGKAYEYMLKRWDKLTLFLRERGAPLENNICERALKMAICHRRNSLFYRTQHGATVGDMFTSLIHTAELHSKNPFEYLTTLLRHARAVAEQPEAWMPWNYQATLARLGSS